MRSQTSKQSPKKGVAGKGSKSVLATKQVKKKNVMPKKVKTLIKKSLLKLSKKKKGKIQTGSNKNDGDSTAVEDRSDTSDTSFVPSSKSSTSRSNSPPKRLKRETKERKEAAKVVRKKVSNIPKKDKKSSILKAHVKSKKSSRDDVKYKLNSDFRKASPKCSKIKTVIRKVSSTYAQKSKNGVVKRQRREAPSHKDAKSNESEEKESEAASSLNKNESSDDSQSKFSLSKDEDCSFSPASTGVSSSNTSGNSASTDTSKSDFERPPKFFTSMRSSRTVDIDVKFYKTSKGSLTISERFLSSKNAEGNKSNNTSNKLITQGPEIDVYTFTEKVDSPKSILSDFTSPSNKNVGRVRPIARVKGTIIDNRSETERQKYSPNRPIEEVVKQLNANKRCDEIKTVHNLDKGKESSLESNKSQEDKEDGKPKQIVSKSYKMVARKSTIPGKTFSSVKLTERDYVSESKGIRNKALLKKPKNPKGQKSQSSDDEFENLKFSLSTKSKKLQYSSSDESVCESNDDTNTKESFESDSSKPRKNKKTRRYKKSETAKKHTSKELRELSKDCITTYKDDLRLFGKEKPNKRRLKLVSMWCGPKRHRMASLNAIAKVHCLYENESRSHVELGLMKTLDRQIPESSKPSLTKKKESKQRIAGKQETSESEFEKSGLKDESSEEDSSPPITRTLRGVPGIRSAGKYWDPKSSTSSSEDSELDTMKRSISTPEKKKAVTRSPKSDTDKSAKMKKTAGVPVKKKRNRNEVTMDLKDMVVQKRMASLNATAILAASYEKRSPKSHKEDSTSDSCSDESFQSRSKNGPSSGVKSELKNEEENPKKETEESSEVDRKQKVEVIVNQDTDLTITGVYSTHHHEGFCTVSGMQYRISSTSHTQTTATAKCEKERCAREDGARYTPLTALSSMQPPAEHPPHPHPCPGPELGGLSRRAAGCSSAFTAPTTTASAAHHKPGYYQPAGPLIKESGADAPDRALARYQPPPPPHYHAPHPPVMQQYGPPYYPPDLCYGRYYRPPGPASYMPPPPPSDPQMVGVGESYPPPPPPQYYGAPCYQHSPQRVPYLEYRGCSCTMNNCPKNVLIGPATGKAPAGGGPAEVPTAPAPPGAALRPKPRAVCAPEAATDAHGSGKDPPLEAEPPAAADAPRPCLLPPNIGGASPKRELYETRVSGGVAGPPSPARGSAGACAPQPPPAAPRRARLGKDMARRSLVPDDTGLLLAAPLPATSDDDVLVISPPRPVPIDLSSDDASTPLLDVKKENDGPTASTTTSPRKADAVALREHNCSVAESETGETPKPSKRRHSRSNLEIDMREAVLDEPCKTNGIGEHVKLQKRRKISSDLSDARPDIKEIDKKPKTKRSPKSLNFGLGKSASKRKRGSAVQTTDKKVFNEEFTADKFCMVVMEEQKIMKSPKTKSALLLDNLLRKNSIDRPVSSYSPDRHINPAELFMPARSVVDSGTKHGLNINNNVIANGTYGNNVQPKTIAAVSQFIEKKLTPSSNNICRLQNVESNVTQKTKSVKAISTVPSIQPQTHSEENNLLKKEHGGADLKRFNSIQCRRRPSSDSAKTQKNMSKSSNDIQSINKIADKLASKALKCKSLQSKPETSTDESAPKSAILDRLGSKQPNDRAEAEHKIEHEPGLKLSSKRCKLAEKSNGELKGPKLLVAKRCVVKCDEASLVVEEACSTEAGGRGGRRRRSGGRRGRRLALPPALLDHPARAPPRWSNGWQWDGEPQLAKVYLNNDSRLDRTARCWPCMRHESGDRVSRGDCVLLRASSARAQPFVARVARLWENPDDGEMMVSLVWYYRPEHTERGRQPEDAPDEVFASRHRDANSVACIEDKCYVLTYNEYCRYRKRMKAMEEGILEPVSMVPPLPSGSEITADAILPSNVSPDLVLFCRKIYDFRSKKIQVPNK